MGKFYARIFGVSLTVLVVILAVNTYVDPYGILGAPWAKDYDRRINRNIMKYTLMKRFEGFDSVVIGSSTSEVFRSEFVDEIFDVKTFSAGVPGSTTLARLSLLRVAQEKSPDLKYVFYIADLFELNENLKEVVEYYYFDKLTSYVDQEFQLVEAPAFKSAIQKFIHHKRTRLSFEYLFGKEFKKHYYDNGSAIDSYDRDLSQEKFMIEIREVFKQWGEGSLVDYEYSQRVESYFHSIVQEIKATDTKLFILISPYHPEFKKMLIEKTDFEYEKFHKLWREFLLSLADNEQIYVLDATEFEQYFDASTKHWVDGVHVTNKTAKILLNEMKKQFVKPPKAQ